MLGGVMGGRDESHLDKLRVADPDTYVWVKGRLDLISPAPGAEAVSLLVDATIWGLSLEAGLGEAVAKGGLELMGRVPDDRFHRYVKLVRRSADTGPTLGRIMATFLAPVMTFEDDLLERFQNTVAIMLRKGTYTLSAPLETMAELLREGAASAVAAYLDLLAAIFAQDITYNQSLRLVYLIPKAVAGFPPRRRIFQIEQLHRVAALDLQLVDPFLDGLAQGSGLLDAKALDDFVGQALVHRDQTLESAVKFLGLSSRAGKEARAALGRAVPLVQTATQINQYLNARIGSPVTVKPLSELGKDHGAIAWVCSDGRHIYLPDEIDIYPTQNDNLALYKALCRLEAGFFEFGTFDFDLEKAADRYPEVARGVDFNTDEYEGRGLCDGQRFVAGFFPGALAADLFDIFEQARVTSRLWLSYPGLMRQVIPILISKAEDRGRLDGGELLASVYAELVLGRKRSSRVDGPTVRLQQQLVQLFNDHVDENSPVEMSARLVCLAFDLVRGQLKTKINRYRPMAFPFDRRLNWAAVGDAFAREEQTARQIKVRLKEMGLDAYTSDLRNRLAEQQGALAVDDIEELVLMRADGVPDSQAAIDLSVLDLSVILQQSGVDIAGGRSSGEDAVTYPEWALDLQDYLHDHTRVYVREVGENSDSRFYASILEQYRGLLANMRRAFELLKPEGLAILRQWPEGDAFDYRALIDFVMDRRAGRIPSDRLFIKRLKQERDVAVMLLVDLSRSTANTVPGGDTTVLDVAKEALVLFCEALQVVGDDYSIGGFSGAGRHCVDFYTIKLFQEALSDVVRSRISALQPQRSTRMGAAIRHAAALLAQAEARVRLMIVVSDGFPNDIGYKNDYAIADTRQSIQEARSRNFYVKAITVNIGSDPRLDDLYGRNHHHVIGDVRELPGKLLRLYGALTRL